MAKYLTVNSKFDPFTYEQMYQAAKDATQIHMAMDEQYDALAANAGVWENMISSTDDRDKDLYNQYSTYMKDLDSAITDLARNGLSPSSRQALRLLNNRYSKEISPIKVAYEAREADRKTRKELGRDDTMMFSFDPNTAVLSDYINGKQPTINHVSGNEISKRAMNQAIASSKRQYDSNVSEVLGGQYFRTMEAMGYTQDEALAFAGGNYNAIPGLMDSINNILESVDYQSYSPIDRENMLRYAMEGALAGLQGSINYDYKLNHAWNNPVTNPPTNSSLAVNPNFFYTTEEAGQYDMLKDYIEQYTDRNGNTKFRLTNKGQELYNRNIQIYYGGERMSDLGSDTVSSLIFNKDDSTNMESGRTSLYKLLTNLGYTPDNDNIDEIIKSLTASGDIKNYDATQRVQYSYVLDESEQDKAKDLILTAYGNSELQGSRFDKESERIIENGPLEYYVNNDKGRSTKVTINKAKLRSKDYKVIKINPSIYGNTYTVMDNITGATFDVPMPKGINLFRERERDRALIYAKGYRDLANSKLKELEKIDKEISSLPKGDRKIVELSRKRKTLEYEIESSKSLYDAAIDSAYENTSQLFVTNKTKPQTFEVYGN